MLICIDSSVIIPGIQSRNSAAARLLDLIGSEFTLVIPRLIALKVTRNLNTPAQVRQFYKMFQRDLKTDVFQVLNAEEFISRWEDKASLYLTR